MKYYMISLLVILMIVSILWGTYTQEGMENVSDIEPATIDIDSPCVDNSYVGIYLDFSNCEADGTCKDQVFYNPENAKDMERYAKYGANLHSYTLFHNDNIVYERQPDLSRIGKQIEDMKDMLCVEDADFTDDKGCYRTCYSKSKILQRLKDKDGYMADYRCTKDADIFKQFAKDEGLVGTKYYVPCSKDVLTTFKDKKYCTPFGLCHHSSQEATEEDDTTQNEAKVSDDDRECGNKRPLCELEQRVIEETIRNTIDQTAAQLKEQVRYRMLLNPSGSWHADTRNTGLIQRCFDGVCPNED